MLVLYKSWKIHNEHSINKKQNGLKQLKMKNDPPSPKQRVTSRD